MEDTETGSEKIKKDLKEKREYLLTWIDRFETAQDIVPHVRKNLEITEWGLNALSDCPDKAKRSIPNSIGNAIDRDKKFVKRILPLIPDYDQNQIHLMSAITTSGTSFIGNFIFETVTLGTPEAREYSDKYSQQYYKMQESHDRPKEVRKLIEKFQKSDVLKRFDNAEKTYWLLKSHTGTRTHFGSDFRNLLDGIKGNLFNLAFKMPRENKSWKVMADRLAKKGPGSAEHSIVMEQEAIFSELYNNLSVIGKDREGDFLKDIENERSKVLDHIYMVLSLVKIEQ
ncbi:MAG: hypothetical protein LLH30_02950 [Candidatus Manganitrophus sp. SA1]|nr:hypothetical protein [Candidatus Manganitrophus morganii]